MRRSSLIVRRCEPLCAETAPGRLAASFLTDQADFFIRHHGPVPELDVRHRIAVAGLVDRPASYTLAELQGRFPAQTVVAAIQCAGNRRAHLQAVAPTSGDPWGIGAIGNAEWTGVRLADVLAAAGIAARARHVAFAAADLADGGGAIALYEVSVPLDIALRDNVLLAWAMNGAALSPDHGYPLRTIVPGAAGVRSVKWLTRIEVRADESTAPMHARDYRRFAPGATAETADWASAPPIYDLAVNSAICEPADGAGVAAGPVSLRGWAMASEGVARVEVSADDGLRWHDAELERGPDQASWVLWRAVLDLAPGAHSLVARATDDDGIVQPADPTTLWNFKGYISTAWHRIAVDVR